MYGCPPLLIIFTLFASKRFLDETTSNKSPSLNPPHLTALSVSLSEASIFPSGHPPDLGFLRGLTLPMQDNPQLFSQTLLM